ncbi:nuclear transport factor 2 family protein [Nannocystaceae bacterium ST9]
MTNPNDGNEPHQLKARIHDLEAREQLKELKARYARGSDAVFNNPGAASALALADLFTDDGVLDLGPFGRYEGRPALLNAFENVLPQGTKWSTHYIVNPLLQIDGHDATGQWYYLIQAVPNVPNAGLIQIFGSYADTYRRTPGGWKIRETISGFFVPPT